MAVKRSTIWYDDALGVLQVSVALLNDDWEPQAEATRQVGPFDHVDEELNIAELRARVMLTDQGGAAASTPEDQPPAT